MSESKTSERRTSIARMILVPANPIKAVAPVTESLRASGRRLRSMGRMIVETEKPDERLVDIADARERFQAAMFHLGRSENELPQIERRASMIFYAMAITAILMTVLAAVSPRMGWLGNSPFPLIDHTVPWIMALAVWMRTGLASLRLYQVRLKALVGWNTWIRDWPSILGAPPAKFAAAAGLAVGSVLIPAKAMAQGVAGASATSALGMMTATPHPDDLAMEWLHRLFPGLADVAGATVSAADPLVPMMYAFNGMLLLVSAGILMWHTLIAAVYAAHTGQSIGGRGSKYHGLWSPIRIVLGISLLAPIKGYCMAQIIVLQVLMAGYGMANGMWNLYVDAALSSNMAASVPTTRLGAGTETALRIVESEVCVGTLRAHAGQYSAGATVWNPLTWVGTNRPNFNVPNTAGQSVTSSMTVVGDPSVNMQVWDYGSTCGIIRMDKTLPIGAGTSQGERDAMQVFTEAKVQALQQLVGKVRQIDVTTDFVARVTPGLGASVSLANGSNSLAQKMPRIREAGREYDQTIALAAQRLVTSLNQESTRQFKETANRMGWASAGSLNFTLTRMMAMAASYVGSAVPEVVSVRVETLNTQSATRLADVMSGLRVVTRQIEEQEFASAASLQLPQDQMQRGPVGRVMSMFTQEWSKRMVDGLALNPVRPMASIQNFGNATLLTAEGLMVAWFSSVAAVNGVDAAAQSVPVAGAVVRLFSGGGAAVLNAAAPFVNSILGGLLIFGAIHAYVLPLIPFILWFYAVMGVAALAAELILAAPLAALLHVRADGEELIEQKQATFYVMGFNALLRPSLLLFGLVVASAMLGVMANFLNRTLGNAILSSQGDSIVGGVGFITMLIVVFYMHFQLCVRCMGLVTQVPAMVADLLGVRDQSRGEHDDSSNVFIGIKNAATAGSRNFAGGALRVGSGGSKTAGDKAPSGPGGGAPPSGPTNPAGPSTPPTGTRTTPG